MPPPDQLGVDSNTKGDDTPDSTIAFLGGLRDFWASNVLLELIKH